MNSNQGSPLGLLSMGYFLKHLPPGYPSSDDQEKPSEGMMGSAVRSMARGGHATTPYEVFITVFCHYMIKVIVGQVGAV